MRKHSKNVLLSSLTVLIAVLAVGCQTLPLGLGVTNSEPVVKDGYGAIAFSPTTQRWHIRWNSSDPDRAGVLAVQYCGTADCAVILQFNPGQCGTFSLGENGSLGVGTGDTQELAASVARAQCELSGQSCKVAPVRCNDES